MSNLPVPHVKQSKETSCGAAALSMVYKYLGKDDQLEETIWERLKVLRPNTNDQYYLQTPDMARDGRGQGFSYFIANAVLDSPELALQPIKEFLALSIPVIVCQKISESSTWGHFRVVTNIESNKITFNDPMQDNAGTIVAVDTFLSLWANANNGEVIGGQFFAIFNKEQIAKKSKFVVSTFEASVSFFGATSLNFN